MEKVIERKVHSHKKVSSINSFMQWVFAAHASSVLSSTTLQQNTAKSMLLYLLITLFVVVVAVVVVVASALNIANFVECVIP